MAASKFGFGQIGKYTPQWAKWFFRIYFFISKAFVGWAAATSIFDKTTLYEITLFVTLLLDPIFYGASKMVGIEPDIESETPKDETTN